MSFQEGAKYFYVEIIYGEIEKVMDGLPSLPLISRGWWRGMASSHRDLSRNPGFALKRLQTWARAHYLNCLNLHFYTYKKRVI